MPLVGLRRKNRVGPSALLFRQRTTSLPQCVCQHLSPSFRIEKSNFHRMFHECGDICRLAGIDKRTNSFHLIVFKSNGDLGGRHTKNHTM